MRTDTTEKVIPIEILILSDLHSTGAIDDEILHLATQKILAEKDKEDIGKDELENL